MCFPVKIGKLLRTPTLLLLSPTISVQVSVGVYATSEKLSKSLFVPLHGFVTLKVAKL